MPNISSIPVRFYDDLSPYSALIDNQPIHDLSDQVTIVNSQVDLNTSDLSSASGNQGNLTTRLSRSINDDGTLKVTAIDSALHSIEEHLDTSNYVRMQLSERTKLSFIADNATNFSMNVETPSAIVPFINTTLNLYQSETIGWRYQSGKVYADAVFPDNLHRYSLGTTTIDYKTYKIAVPYKSGTLRVYANGVRLFPGIAGYVPVFSGGALSSWVSLTYSEGTASGGIVHGQDFTFTTTLSTSIKVYCDADVE